MATQVQSRNNTGVWIALGILAAIVIIGIAWMVAASGNQQTAPLSNTAQSAQNAAQSAAQSAGAAAQSAENAAANAADNAGQSMSDAAGRVTATIPGPGDSTVTVNAPANNN